MKKVIILMLIGVTLGCLVIAFVKNSELGVKANVASYLMKHHYYQGEVDGVMSNAVKNYHNMYDETF